jgi:hypothetical protein
MKRIRILGLALVAGFALSVVASSATASPVFYTKVEVGATASTPVKFTGTLGATFFEGSVSKTKIECSTGTLSGEVSGSMTTKSVAVTLKGCKTGSGNCRGAGEPESVLKTSSLEGELGDVTPGVPGLRLFDEATGRGGELMSFTCLGGSIGVKVRGSFIGQLSGASGSTVPEGKFATSHSLKMVEKAGVQKFSLFVGESLSEQLEQKAGEGAYEKVGLSAVATLTSEGVSNLGFTK